MPQGPLLWAAHCDWHRAQRQRRSHQARRWGGGLFPAGQRAACPRRCARWALRYCWPCGWRAWWLCRVVPQHWTGGLALLSLPGALASLPGALLSVPGACARAVWRRAARAANAGALVQAGHVRAVCDLALPVLAGVARAVLAGGLGAELGVALHGALGAALGAAPPFSEQAEAAGLPRVAQEGWVQAEQAQALPQQPQREQGAALNRAVFHPALPLARHWMALARSRRGPLRR